MHFTEQVHWADGLFLQPHHFQILQRNMIENVRNERNFYLPYKYGLIDLDINRDALLSRRVVINSFSAIMPDGQELSMPGNCTLSPLNIDKPTSLTDNVLVVYLVLPSYSAQSGNLATPAHPRGLYQLKENHVYDENSGDNEIVLMTRRMNPYLEVRRDRIANGSYIPLMRLNWISYQGQEPVLVLDDEYMPPFMLLSPECQVSRLVNELLFLIKNYREHLLEGLENSNFENKPVQGEAIIKLMQLNILSEAHTQLTNTVMLYKIAPFTIYNEISVLLSKLQSLDFHHQLQTIPTYNHDDALPQFKWLIEQIKTQLSAESQVSYFTRVDFILTKNPQILVAVLDDVELLPNSELYLMFTVTNPSEKLIKEVLSGDNLRVLDSSSIDMRMRGFKLIFQRFAPRQLPTVAGSMCFKIDIEETPEFYANIQKDRVLIIDRAIDVFENLQASLFVINSNNNKGGNAAGKTGGDTTGKSKK